MPAFFNKTLNQSFSFRSISKFRKVGTGYKIDSELANRQLLRHIMNNCML